MAGIARVETRFSIMGPTGLDSPFAMLFSQSVTRWTGKRVITLATGITDQSLIDFGTGGITTIAQIMLVSTQNISIKLGAAGSNVAITILANAPLLLSGIALTALSVSNASGQTATITYALASLL